MCAAAYFLSFGKYALEAMLRNEFATVPYGSNWNLFDSVKQSLDPALSRWGNIAVLMICARPRPSRRPARACRPRRARAAPACGCTAQRRDARGTPRNRTWR